MHKVVIIIIVRFIIVIIINIIIIIIIIIIFLTRMDKCIKWSTDYFMKAHKSGDSQCLI